MKDITTYFPTLDAATIRKLWEMRVIDQRAIRDIEIAHQTGPVQAVARQFRCSRATVFRARKTWLK